MRILFLCHRLPYPPNRGGKIRPFNMIRHLATRHSVVVASLAGSDAELREGEGLEDHCDEVIVEVLPDVSRWFRAFASLPRGTASSQAYFWSPQLARRIEALLRRVQFDVVFVHCAFVAPYVANRQGCVRILDFGDLDSAKWMAYSQSRAFPLSLGYGLEAKKLRAYERHLAERFDYCSVTTQGEMDEFRTLGVATPCTVIPNGVDTSYFTPTTRRAERRVVVFLGRMDYFPNVDGVNDFVQNIWPEVRRAVPDTEFRIVGSSPGAGIRALAGRSGIQVTGHVSDIRDHVRDALVSVAPLRIARGTQNKILESMAMGIPVVATSQAARGIQAVAGQHLLVSDRPDVFARHVVSLLESEADRRQIGEAAIAQVAVAHNWTKSMELLDGMLEDAVDRERPSVDRLDQAAVSSASAG